MPNEDQRTKVCYLAPWIDYGGSDKGTLDWFKWIDRERFAPILITTQPSDNRRLHEVYKYADEVWVLPEFLAGQHFPNFIFDLLHSRDVDVLHIMNSRIGYELLPDLASLDKPPVVVVQLHVEEPDKSGYVRYVTTRYGNLVDGFSVSSHHLAQAVEEYDIPPGKIHVIPTGVDAQSEFAPGLFEPVAEVDPTRFNILYPGRLADQKDPLLMVEVVRDTADRHPDVCVHVVGDGPLEDAVRERVSALGLVDNVQFHPPSRELARWYAACDLLLMTSVFEGVPYVIYESMAMALPVVAPALPGNVELMADTGGVLVVAGAPASEYASAVCRLIGDPSAAKQLAGAGRDRISKEFGCEAMGRRHGELYTELLARREKSLAARRRALAVLGESEQPQESAKPAALTAASASTPATDQPLRFVDRPSRGQPRVSVVIPCFNHGRFIRACVESVTEQDYPDVEVIIVDDASNDPGTVRVLGELQAESRACVLRMETNHGPSVARNVAIAEATGRYILPVDADNLLLPHAITNLVQQLQSAGERIGYIYPNPQYFGTRDDYFIAPNFNLSLLLGGNYCDTCSLIDRRVFDAGFSYAEDMLLGHEDWDFFLSLAAHGVRGEPARAKTMLYRKHGFTRSDSVEYLGEKFRREIPARHPELFGDPADSGRFGPWRGVRAAIKRSDAPALSIMLLDPVDFSSAEGRLLLERLQAQSCQDFELLAECPVSPNASFVRRIPPGLCDDRASLAAEMLPIGSGQRALVVDDGLSELVAESGFVQRLLLTLWANPKLSAIALTDTGDPAQIPYRLLSDGDGLRAHAVVFMVEAASKLETAPAVRPASVADDLVSALAFARTAIQWRHQPRGTNTTAAYEACSDGNSPLESWKFVRLGSKTNDPHRAAELKCTEDYFPGFPATQHIPRWTGEVSWLPPDTELLTRQRNQETGRHILHLGRKSPEGYELDHDIGAINRFSPPGTVRLEYGPGGEIRTVERGSPRSDEYVELGHLELSPLPLFQTVYLATLDDGSQTLISGDHDGLHARAMQLDWLGYIEAFPNQPSRPPDARITRSGKIALMRTIDYDARRHRCAVGSEALPDLVCELGALHMQPTKNSIPVWIDDGGLLSTSGYTLRTVTPSAKQLARWSLAPAKWSLVRNIRGRSRAIGRRTLDSLRLAAIAARATDGFGREARPRHVVGYLYATPDNSRVEIFSGQHPITGDQLVTRYPLEAIEMGYKDVVSLGFAIDEAIATGGFEVRRVPVPWASKFGLEARLL